MNGTVIIRKQQNDNKKMYYGEIFLIKTEEKK